jgi:hypothetical protein
MSDEDSISDLPHRRALVAQREGRRGGEGVSVPNTGDMVGMAQSATPMVMQALLEVAMSGASESARVSACKEILDRGHGKPGQSVTIYDGAREMRGAWDAVDAEVVDGG